jgi:integrase
MAKQRKKPVLTHCKVVLTSHPSAPWRVSYPVEENGLTRRKRRMFSTEEKAMDFATEHEKGVADHGVRFGSVTAEARRAFDYYRDARADLLADEIEFPTFEKLVMNAVAALRREHADRQRNRMTIAEGVEAFMTYKKTRVGKRHWNDLAGHLGRFAKAYGTDHIDRITSGEVEGWVMALDGLGTTTRNKMRTSLKSFFAHGALKSQGWCSHNPLDDISKEKTAGKEPKAYTPDESNRILQTALAMDSPILPSLVLGMFSGLRPTETMALDLGVINFAAETFRTPAFHPDGEPTKTGARQAPLTAACKAWLASQERRTGLAWQGKENGYTKEMRLVLETAGVKGIYDGPRHSFVTYRTAEIRDVARVADECGNSPNIIKKHYRELVDGSAAEKYFAIRPEITAENVTRIEAGRASA